MAKIEYVSAHERAFVPGTAALAGRTDIDDETVQEARHLSVFMRHPGSQDTPQMFEVCYAPDAEASAHAHEVDEILVVTEGSARFGNRVCGVGSSIFIPAMTLYSFKAGPDGLTFLNFRSHVDSSLIRKDEFMARRAHGKAASPS